MWIRNRKEPVNNSGERKNLKRSLRKGDTSGTPLRPVWVRITGHGTCYQLNSMPACSMVFTEMLLTSPLQGDIIVGGKLAIHCFICLKVRYNRQYVFHSQVLQSTQQRCHTGKNGGLPTAVGTSVPVGSEPPGKGFSSPSKLHMTVAWANASITISQRPQTRTILLRCFQIFDPKNCEMKCLLLF